MHPEHAVHAVHSVHPVTLTHSLTLTRNRHRSDWNERVLPSIVNEVLKQVVAQFNAAALLTQREQVSRLIQRNLIERGNEFGIVMDDVAIIDLAFGREFTNAVESKQVGTFQ